MKSCVNCGTTLPDEANFCYMCGGTVFTAPTPEETAAPELIQGEILPEESPVIPEEPIPEETVPDEPIPEESEPEEPEPAPEESLPDEPPVSPPVLDPINYYTDAGLMPTPSRKHSKVVIAVGIALLAVILVSLALLHPQRRFMTAIRAGKSQAAGELYFDALADKERRKTKADAQLAAYVDEQLALYLDNEKSYDDFLTALQTINEAGIDCPQIPGALEQAEVVLLRRETFETANAALTGGDYATAITLYRELTAQEGENAEAAAAGLEESVIRYRAWVLQTAEASIAANRFGVAYATLKEALALLPGDQALLDVYNDCIERHYDFTIDAIIDEAVSLRERGDYIGALTHLDSAIADHPEEIRLRDERNACVTAYEEYVFNEVYRLAAEENYPQGADLAAQGLSIFESERVLQLHQVCLSHIPVNLSDMTIYSNDTVGGVWNEETLKTDAYLEDRYGVTYSHSLSVGCGSLTYLVDHRYDTFTGVVAFPKGLTSNNAKKSATLVIYGDGVLLASFKNFSSSSLSTAFKLDIADYKKITLEWSCKGFNNWLDWGDFATIFDGVLTPIPQELVDGVG